MCPSDAAIAISLGPTNPLLIDIAAETLVFRRTGISPVLWLLVPTFLLVHAPRWLTPSASSQSTILSYRLCISWKIQTWSLENWNKDRDVRIEPITSDRILILLFVHPDALKTNWKIIELFADANIRGRGQIRTAVHHICMWGLASRPPVHFINELFYFMKELSSMKCTNPQLRYYILAPIICGANSLDEWAVTLSLKDGCF